MSKQPALYPLSFSTEYFHLHINQSKKCTDITMQMLNNIVNTNHLPLTYSILESSLPSILKAKCFNEENIPFREEVKQTEIGHLFEHILLEYLCILKLSKGNSSATFSGVTNWNWKKEVWGTFHIHITMRKKDMLLLPLALEKTIHLLQVIIFSSPPLPFPSFEKPLNTSQIVRELHN